MQKFNKETKQLTKMKKRIKEITFLLDEFNEESNSQPVIKVKKSRRGRKKKEDKEKESVKMESTSTIKTNEDFSFMKALAKAFPIPLAPPVTTTLESNISIYLPNNFIADALRSFLAILPDAILGNLSF